jgi:hypothetical protein
MTTRCYCDMCGVATTDLENRCEACGAGLPAFETQVRTDPIRAFASARGTSLKYWPFLAGVTLLLLVIAIVPTRPWQARDWPIALFFASPLILGLIVALVLIALALAIFAHFTQAGTEHTEISSGGRSSGNSDSASRTPVPVGRPKSWIISGTHFFNEQTTGRIDEDGNIYRGTNFVNEEKVGRIDDEGTIYMGTSWLSEDKAGRLDEEGNVHRGTNFLNETKVGRVDSEGNIFEGSSFLNERLTGRIERQE